MKLRYMVYNDYIVLEKGTTVDLKIFVIKMVCSNHKNKKHEKSLTMDNHYGRTFLPVSQHS